ncbi:hypothetical protein F0562_018255 [Nyssa sinensis]|uniref:Uncharacterized protein n=1 Tax=Nyssa sinensis TaxID=561372 RepID=A0A5J4ZBJ3_9ASTE|nr:hypothetical protein F0562_018255 [Nyssa sinensis]
MSQALGTTKRSWSVYAKEMLAIIHAIQTLRPYLLGRRFYIQTDQRSLKYLLEQRIATPEQQKWVTKLFGYDYEITYKPGRENNAADALSRVAGSPSLDALFVSQTQLWDTIKAEAGKTSFQALYGRPPPTIPHYHEGYSPVHEVDQSLVSRDALLRQLKDNLSAANNRMKQQVDFKRRDIEYQVGDFVFLKLHPYRQQSVFKRAYQKLASRFYGPYQIEEKIGKVAYKLNLSLGSRIHPVFHVSLLKKKLGDTIVASTELPPLVEDGHVLMEPEAILDTRWIKKGSKFVTESLIK